MAKYFDVLMAGLISGIVALTTTFLGLGGTVIGAVLGAIFYQIISVFIKEPLESTIIRKVENEVIYVFPLILIAIFQIIFTIALAHSQMTFFNSDFLSYFYQLEEITNNNLLRSMGIGLIAMGLYPIFQSKNIKKEYGIIVLFLGIILLIRGLIDTDPLLKEIYFRLFTSFDLLLAIIILLILIFLIIKILSESITLYLEIGKHKEELEIYNQSKKVKHDNLAIKEDITSTMPKNREYFVNDEDENSTEIANSNNGINKDETNNNNNNNLKNEFKK